VTALGTSKSATTAALVCERHQPRKKGKVEGSAGSANILDVLNVYRYLKDEGASDSPSDIERGC
jgi:hypothetical protein